MTKEKLVRDRIPIILNGSAERGAFRTAKAEEVLGLLKRKLMEEAMEYVREPSLEELADVLEVLRALVELHGITLEGLEALQSKRRRERATPAMLQRELLDKVKAYAKQASLQRLAEILNVVRILALTLDATPQELEERRQQKEKQRGGFKGRVVMRIP